MMTEVNTSESVAGLTRLQLENWERSVKARDDELLAAPVPEHVDMPPPRKYVEIGRPEILTGPKGKKAAEPAAAAVVAGTTVVSKSGEEEKGKGEGKEKDPESKIMMEEAKKLAEKEKAAGNEHFKAKRWDKAVECYTRAMKYDSTNAVYPANRAMCLLKLEKYEDAEKDCTTAVRIDPKYTKAFYRRATARKQQGKYVLALDDLNIVLRAEPGNKQAVEEKKVVNELLAQKLQVEESKSECDADIAVHESKEVTVKDEVKEVEKTRASSDQQQRPKVLIEEIPSSNVSSVSPEESQPSKKEDQKDASVDMVAEKTKVETESKTEEVVKKTDDEEKQIQPKTFVKPRTFYDFDVLFNSLGRVEDRASLLSTIPTKEYVSFFKDSVTPSLCAAFILAVVHISKTDKTKALAILGALTTIGRFGILSMTLPSAQKTCLFPILLSCVVVVVFEAICYEQL